MMASCLAVLNSPSHLFVLTDSNKKADWLHHLQLCSVLSASTHFDVSIAKAGFGNGACHILSKPITTYGCIYQKHQEKIRRFKSEELGDCGKDNHKGVISEEKEIIEPKKKTNRLCWTIELHDKFMNAIDTLGEDACQILTQFNKGRGRNWQIRSRVLTSSALLNSTKEGEEIGREVYADEDVIQICSSIVVHRVPRPSIPIVSKQSNTMASPSDSIFARLPKEVQVQNALPINTANGNTKAKASMDDGFVIDVSYKRDLAGRMLARRGFAILPLQRGVRC